MKNESATRILVLQGHPDAGGGHYGHALAAAYGAGARDCAREVRVIDVAALDFAWLKSKQSFEGAATDPAIAAAQRDLLWAQHVVIFHPLWLGMVPAVLKAFLEQVLRPGFAFAAGQNGLPQRLLKGRSARIIVTMGMPAFAFRWFFGAHGLKALRRNILSFCGFGPIRDTVIGSVESATQAELTRWLQRVHEFGRRGI